MKRIPNDILAICDVCGWECKASQMRLRWDNLFVCKADWERRHPLDTPTLPRNEIYPNPNYARPNDQLISIDEKYPNGLTYDDF